MSIWRDHARNGIKALDSLTDGPPQSELPDFGPRGATERLDHLTLISSREHPQAKPFTILHTARGSAPIVLAWAVWCAFGIWMIVRSGGGGAWMLWFGLGIPGFLCHNRNLMIVTSHGLLIRRGITSHRDIGVNFADMADIWARQGLWGRIFNWGRVGMRLRSGEVVWGPLVDDPWAAKNAIVTAATGRRPLGLASEERIELTGR